MKTSEVILYLFGKPEWEFQGNVTPETIRKKGDELKVRLHEIAADLEKLCENGWDYEAGLYDIMLFKSISKTKAERELAGLGIDADVHMLDDLD
ncbi:MAG: hypothetical protein NUV67_01490 [archaeon]|nr:hypothetical protein [archaeon]